MSPKTIPDIPSGDGLMQAIMFIDVLRGDKDRTHLLNKLAEAIKHNEGLLVALDEKLKVLAGFEDREAEITRREAALKEQAAVIVQGGTEMLSVIEKGKSLMNRVMGGR